eukprot:6213209-Pleurochrysis_carterae.AAC.2
MPHRAACDRPLCPLSPGCLSQCGVAQVAAACPQSACMKQAYNRASDDFKALSHRYQLTLHLPFPASTSDLLLQRPVDKARKLPRVLNRASVCASQAVRPVFAGAFALEYSH